VWGKPSHIIKATTRQVEPEWDADSRALAESVAEYDRGCCPGCGVHRSLRDNPDEHLYKINENDCQICAGVERHARRVSARDHDWEQRNPAPDSKAPLTQQIAHAGKKRPRDGRHVYLQHMTPEQAELAKTQDQRPKEG